MTETPGPRELLRDFAVELVVGLGALAALAVSVDLVATGWNAARVATVAGAGSFAALAAYGVVLRVRGRSWCGVLPAVATGAALLVLAWAYVLLAGCC